MTTSATVDTKKHALRMTGDCAIVVGTLDAARLSSGFTLEAWVKLDGADADVELFSAPSLGGTGQALAPGRYDDLSKFRVGTAAVSARVPRGYWLVLFQEVGCRGVARTLRDDSGDLGPEWAGKARSCLVLDTRSRRCDLAVVYSEPGFRGRAAAAVVGRVEDLRSLLGDSHVASIAAPPGLEVTLYSDVGCVGRRAAYEGEVSGLTDTGGVFRSLVVSPSEPRHLTSPMLYSGPSYSGTGVVIPADSALPFPPPSSKDGAAPSLQIPSGWRVRLYASADGKGPSRGVSGSHSNLAPSLLQGARSIRASRIVAELPTGAMLHSAKGLAGAAWELPFGRYSTVGRFGAIQSITVSPGHRVVVFTEPDFKGTMKRLDADSPDLTDSRIGSLMVVREARVLAAPKGFGLHVDFTPPSHAVRAEEATFGGAPVPLAKWSHLALAVSGRTWTWFLNGREVKREERDAADLGGEWRIGEGVRGDIGEIVVRAGALGAKELAAGRFSLADKSDTSVVRAWQMEPVDGDVAEATGGDRRKLPAGEAFWVQASLPRSPLLTGLGQRLMRQTDEHGRRQIQAARETSHAAVVKAHEKAALRVSAAQVDAVARSSAARIDSLIWLDGGRPSRVTGRGEAIHPDEMCWWFERSEPKRIQFFDDDRLLLVVHDNGTAVIWRVETLVEEHRFKVPNSSSVWCFDNDGWKLFSYDDSGKSLYYDLMARKPLELPDLKPELPPETIDHAVSDMVVRRNDGRRGWLLALLVHASTMRGNQLILKLIDAFSGRYASAPIVYSYVDNLGFGGAGEYAPNVQLHLVWMSVGKTPKTFVITPDLRTVWLLPSDDMSAWTARWDLASGPPRTEPINGGVPLIRVTDSRSVQRAYLDDGTGNRVKQVNLLDERRVVKTLDPLWGYPACGVYSSQPVSVGPGSTRVVWIREPMPPERRPSGLAWADIEKDEPLPEFGSEYNRVIVVGLSGNGRYVATYEDINSGYYRLRLRGTPLNPQRNEACYAVDVAEEPTTGVTYLAVRSPWHGIARLGPHEIYPVRKRERAVHTLTLDLSDPKQRRLFWIEDPGVLCSAPLDGTGDVVTSIANLIAGPEGIWDLSFDAETRRLVWTNGREIWGAIVAKNGTVGAPRVLVSHGRSPTPIAVLADAKRVYWIDRTLQKVQYFEGNDAPRELYDVTDPHATLALDGDRIYWCGKHTRMIEAAVLDDPGLICHLEAPTTESGSGQRVSALEDTSLHGTDWAAARTAAVGGVRIPDGRRVASFDGQSAHVDLGPLFVNAERGFTIEAVVRCERVTEWGTILDLGNGPDGESVFVSRDGGSERVMLCVRRGPEQSKSIAGGALTLGKWLHLVAVIDASGSARLYLDGKKIAEGTLAAPRSVLRTQCFVGRGNRSRDGWFAGDVALLKVWNYSLTDEQIAARFAEPFGVVEAANRAYHRSLLSNDDVVTYLMSGDRDGLTPAVPLFPLSPDGAVALQSKVSAAHVQLIQAQRAHAEAQAKIDAERLAAQRAAHAKLLAAHAEHEQALADARSQLERTTADTNRQREDAHRRLAAASDSAAEHEQQARIDAAAGRERALDQADTKKRSAADEKRRRIREAQGRLDAAREERRKH